MASRTIYFLYKYFINGKTAINVIIKNNKFPICWYDRNPTFKESDKAYIPSMDIFGNTKDYRLNAPTVGYG
jgi:hypothetical protein